MTCCTSACLGSFAAEGRIEADEAEQRGARSELVEAKGRCINSHTILGSSLMHALAVRSASLSLI
jgi:hypothetical protein